MSEQLQAQIRPAAAEPDGALILLHGRGVNMYDLVPLANELDPERRLVAITPQAPLELSPGGWHWYVIERVGFPNPQTFWQTFETLAGFIEDVLQQVDVSLARTVIGGFSQGAVMSYAVALGEGRPHPAGVVGFSGFVPTVDGFRLADGLQGYPVATGHGTLDPVIDVEFARRSRAMLEEAGCEVLYRESPMAHTIDPAFVTDVRGWLAERVPPRT